MPSETSKVSRKEARKQQLAQEKRKRTIMIVVPIVIGAAAIGIFAFVRLRPVEGTSNFGAQERGHDASTTFANNGLPPVGGTHNPQFQDCGIYTRPVDTSLAVHSMEHGAVWLAYRPDLPDQDVETLQDLVRGRAYTLLSPYPGLKHDVVATAWGVQLEPDSVSDERIGEFISRNIGAGPEPGAPCSGGVRVPLQ